MRVCYIVLGAFGVAYALALALLIIGTFGLFGQERDPLSGVFLLPFGLPWNQMIGIFPQRLAPWLAAASPLVNLIALFALCRFLSSRRS